MSSRLATVRRRRPVLSFHWTSTMSAHSILGSIRLSNIYFLIGERKAKDYEGPVHKTPYKTVMAKHHPLGTARVPFLLQVILDSHPMARQALVILFTVL